MQNLQGKKLLILGGAYQHCKVVEAAKRMGIITYVTDYLPIEDAPAKQIADHYYMYNITEIDEIVAECKREGIDGAIALFLDPCQRPYQQICEKAGFPCFGTKEQYLKLTDKNLFKQCCLENDVDIIPSYKESDFQDEATCAEKVQFPVFIKPCDSRGSRGQTICYDYEQAITAIEIAKNASSNGEIVIEKYMENCDDFTISYLVIDGEPFLLRTADLYPDLEKYGLSRTCALSCTPSYHREMYMDSADGKIRTLIKSIGLKNAPIFMQGFIDGDTIRVYDPGLRYPGTEFERMFRIINGMSSIDALIEFALRGKISEEFKAIQGMDKLKGKIAVTLFPDLFPGMIKKIDGWDEIKRNPAVISAFSRYKAGDVIEESHDVNQRLAEIDMVCDDWDEFKSQIDWIYKRLKVTNINNRNMLVPKLDLDALVSKREK